MCNINVFKDPFYTGDEEIEKIFKKDKDNDNTRKLINLSIYLSIYLSI